MDYIANDTSLIEPCDMLLLPVGAQNPSFLVVGHRLQRELQN